MHLICFLLHYPVFLSSSNEIFKERAPDEKSLRRLIMGACENRATNTLPLGGCIDTSTAVWEVCTFLWKGSSLIFLLFT